MKKKIKIACIGAGKHAVKNVLPIFKKSKNFSLKGVYCRDIQKSKKVAEQLKCYIFIALVH